MQQDIAVEASYRSVDRALARVAAKQHGVFSRAQAVGFGGTRGHIEYRIHTGRWEPLYPGVYLIAGAPQSWRSRLLAACLAAGGHAAASHVAAGALWAIPGGDETVRDVSVPNERRVRRPGITVHHVYLNPVDVTVVDAIPVTTATRTILDLAGVLAPDVLAEALDDVLRRRLTTVSRLRWRLERLGRRPGSFTLRELLTGRSRSGGGPESVLETRFLQLVHRAGLPQPACQHTVRDRGRVLARVDFAYPHARLAIEVDGYRWHSSRARWESDLSRRNDLTSRGWRVVHFTSADLERRPDHILRVIQESLGLAE